MKVIDIIGNSTKRKQTKANTARIVGVNTGMNLCVKIAFLVVNAKVGLRSKKYSIVKNPSTPKTIFGFSRKKLKLVLIDSIAFDSSMTAAGIEITNGVSMKNMIIKTIKARPLTSTKFVFTPKKRRISVTGETIRIAIMRPIPIKLEPCLFT